MANDYCTWGEVEASNPDITWGSTYDSYGALLVTRASRLIDRHAKVEPGFFYVSTDSTRWFPGTGSSHMWIGRLAAAPTTVSMALTGVVDNAAGSGGTYTALTTSDYQLWPANAALESRPYQRLDIAGSTYTAWVAGEKTIKVVGKFGWATNIPDDLKLIAIAETVRYLQRSRQGFADTGAIPEISQLAYTHALDPVTVAELDELLRVLKPKKGSQ
jgi:hypothetical protein